jgi:predicted dienelactone hydrolase
VNPAFICLAVLAASCAFSAHAHPEPPSVAGIDAPELAALGTDPVGFKSVTLVHKQQADLLAADPNTRLVPLHDRKLVVDLWYPANVRKGAQRVRYSAKFWGEPPQPPVTFTVPGLAVHNARARGKSHPLVIVSHGYSNAPASMTWLTENLASKGYIVAGIHHEDPNPYVISPERRAIPNFNRPRDIVFVIQQLKVLLGDQVNPAAIALIGYSQGGYGVLTAGGATLDPDGPSMSLVPGGWLRNYARGTEGAAELSIPGLKAIVALAPAGGLPRSAWGREGLASITAPLLLIQGDSDPVVDYKTGGLSVYEGATRSDRYLLTYKQAGHSIALNPAPSEMRRSVWDLDWFEDPIWRQDRINAINLHFITAFLGLHVRGQTERAEWLNVPVVNSDDGVWNAPPGTPWGAYSPGGKGVTLWKGFQRRHARGMELRHAPPEGAK